MQPHTQDTAGLFLTLGFGTEGLWLPLWSRAALTSALEVDSEKRAGFIEHAGFCAQHSNPQILVLGQGFR